MKKIITLLLLVCMFTSCRSQSCNDLPEHFSSYDEAVQSVQNAEWQIDEGVNTSKSSWIRSAHYYSCDGQTGYFIFTTDSHIYIHANVPVEIWNGFKNADSFGRYYDENIKDNYRIELN